MNMTHAPDSTDAAGKYADEQWAGLGPGRQAPAFYCVDLARAFSAGAEWARKQGAPDTTLSVYKQPQHMRILAVGCPKCEHEIEIDDVIVMQSAKRRAK